jgi:putative endonuclease
MSRRYYVYIMTNRTNRVLYTGVTNDLARRVGQHKQGTGGSFTKKYRVNKLVYAQVHPTARDAITREKQIKAGPRQKKVDLVESINPDWQDLSDDIPV